jgi:hypothetical protein
MDADRFDSLARSFITPSSRRSIVSLLGAAGIGGALAAALADDAEAKKKKKKKCKPCRKKKKGKCKGKKPDGTPCGDSLVCENGQCVSATCDPACIPPEECVDGACTCPSAQACGEVCCAEDPECFGDYCLCDDAFCSCPADDFLCGSPPNTQCCLDSDTCDPESLCVTDTCSADNAFCTLEFAFCNDSDTCGCFQRVESPTSVCADISSLTDCPVVSECTGDAQCAGDVCVNMSCCDPEQPGIGVCLPLCPEPFAERSGRERRSGASRKRALLRDRG